MGGIPWTLPFLLSPESSNASSRPREGISSCPPDASLPVPLSSSWSGTLTCTPLWSLPQSQEKASRLHPYSSTPTPAAPPASSPWSSLCLGASNLCPCGWPGRCTEARGQPTGWVGRQGGRVARLEGWQLWEGTDRQSSPHELQRACLLSCQAKLWPLAQMEVCMHVVCGLQGPT